VAFYSFHLYTEVPSALCLALSLGLLLGSPGPAEAGAAALLASALPWLHVKMIPAAGVLGLLGLLRLRGRSLVVFLGVAGAMGAVYLAYFQHIYGHPTPLAIYGGAAPAEPGASPLRAAAGLLLDRSFGLLPYAPVFLLALPGLGVLARRPWRESLPYALLAGAVLAPVLEWRMWWGGQCPPGRLLVPLVPFLGIVLALRAAGPIRGLMRWRWPLLLSGLALATFMIAEPARLLLLNRGARPTRVWGALSGAWPVGRYLPSLTVPDPAETRVALLWLAAMGGLIVLDQLALRRDAVDRLFRGLALPLVLALTVGVLVDEWARAGSEPVREGVPLPAEGSGGAEGDPARSVREAQLPAVLVADGLEGARREGPLQDLLDRRDESDLEIGPDVLGDVLLHRLFVAFGEEHLLDP
jgi:hypothetical protein